MPFTLGLRFLFGTYLPAGYVGDQVGATYRFASFPEGRFLYVIVCRVGITYPRFARQHRGLVKYQTSSMSDHCMLIGTTEPLYTTLMYLSQMQARSQLRPP